jgi:hypothetical protein
MSSSYQQVMSPATNFSATTQPSIAKLDEQNYHTWSFKVQMILEEKDLWDVVNGDDERPSTSEMKKAWDKRSRKALAIICLAISDSQLVHVRHCKTAREAWVRLSEVHQARGLAARLFLRRKFFTLQMASGTAMQDHIAKVTMMAEQLSAIGAPVQQEDIVMVLLCSLPADFDNLIVSLESRADDLTVEFVASRLLHAEIRRAETSSTTGVQDNAFVTKEHRRKNGGKGITKGNCYNCGKPGHFAKECRQKNPKRNNIRASAATMEESHLFVSTIGRGLMECWLIDSGASQHQTPRKDWFAEYKEIEPRKVFLGDNHALEAIGIGSVKLALHVGGRVQSHDK